MASVVVLGTCHQLQGIQKQTGSLADQDYKYWVEQQICRHQIDFIFEEASGLGPTTARELAQLRSIQYLDIDPHPSDRNKCGIARDTVLPDWIHDPGESREIAYCVNVEDQAKREDLWLPRILEHQFTNGLVICGYFHILSVALRLRSGGFDAKAFYYMPHHKLGVSAVSGGSADDAE